MLPAQQNSVCTSQDNFDIASAEENSAHVIENGVACQRSRAAYAAEEFDHAALEHKAQASATNHVAKKAASGYPPGSTPLLYDR